MFAVYEEVPQPPEQVSEASLIDMWQQVTEIFQSPGWVAALRQCQARQEGGTEAGGPVY